VTSEFGSFAAATNSTLDGTVRFVGGTQSFAVPAGHTYKVLVTTTRAFNKTNNTTTNVLNVDVGFATSSSATGTSITQSDGTTAASAINSGIPAIGLAVTGGNGSPSIVPSTIPVSVSAVLTLAGGVGGTTYHYGMIGTSNGGWSTGRGTISVLVLSD
jgi:hypothetical protein